MRKNYHYMNTYTGELYLNYHYMNTYTGELYLNLRHAIKCIVSDFIHYPTCRNLQMFKLEKGDF